MTDEYGQAKLRQIVDLLTAELDRLESRLRHLGDVHHYQHTMFAWRSESMARYLRSAQLLSGSYLYRRPSRFSGPLLSIICWTSFSSWLPATSK